ncbi:hypothetical protein [Streptosporangium sp. KLBMP 9127]|nr:hypothetical protein [Streptosporangium sp. KLBMP 9127]
MVENEEPLSPSESLRLIEDQRVATVRRLGGDPLVLYVPWGVAWLGGFGALFLHYGLAGEPIVPISIDLALGVLFTLITAALVISSALNIRRSVKIKGGSAESGMMYGYAWFLAFVTMGVISVRFGQQLPAQERGLLWASTSLMIVSALYMAGAAIWQARPMFWIGAALAVLNTAGTLAGAGWHALLVSVFGGGGFILAGLLLRRRQR